MWTEPSGPFTPGELGSKSENFLWCLNFFLNLFRQFFLKIHVRVRFALGVNGPTVCSQIAETRFFTKKKDFIFFSEIYLQNKLRASNINAQRQQILYNVMRVLRKWFVLQFTIENAYIVKFASVKICYCKNVFLWKFSSAKICFC